ncbi:MAG: hypothetical protein IKP72_07175 [Clostridia bacterium]|nr:hypothetical protein [Clostridia bacterium]
MIALTDNDVQHKKGAVKKRIEKSGASQLFSNNNTKEQGHGKKSVYFPFPQMKDLWGNQAAVIFFIFRLWYLYRL